MKPEAKPICSICGKEGKYKGIGIACNTPGCGQPKEQLTPEELAACAVRAWNLKPNEETRLLGYGSFEKGYLAARAESAKEIADLRDESVQLRATIAAQIEVAGNMRAEIADLNDSLSVAQTHVATLLIVESRLRDKIETLKAQVEGLRKDLISCRGSVKTDLNQTERMLLAKEKHNEQDTPIYIAASAEVRRLFELKERIDAAIAQEKPNDR